MDELIVFVRAALDEDERVASIIQDGGYLPVAWHAHLRPDGSADLYAEVRISYPPDATSEIDEEPFAHLEADRLQHQHIVRWDPARVLAEVKAKRRILDVILAYEAKIDGEWGCCHSADAIGAGRCPEIDPNEIHALRLLAQPYAGWPGWREEWAV